jgi:hypothetical protein
VPRYFFHISDGVLIPDLEGSELPDLAAARVEAVAVAGGMLRDHAPDFWRTCEWRVIVTDDAHFILFSLSCQALAAPVPPLVYDPRPHPPKLHVGGS